MWVFVCLCASLERARTPRKCFVHCAGLCLLVRARTQQRFVLSMHPVRVRLLCCLLCGYTSCMREGCAAHCVAYTSFLPVDAKNCPTPSSKPASPARAAYQLFCNSGVRLVQVPRPRASTCLATRCPHMREVPRPVRVRRGCRCARMHRL